MISRRYLGRFSSTRSAADFVRVSLLKYSRPSNYYNALAARMKICRYSMLPGATIVQTPRFLSLTLPSCSGIQSLDLNRRYLSAQAASGKFRVQRTQTKSKVMSAPRPQDFDYLLVLDFEATCSDEGKIKPYQEIIEMPVLALNTRSWTVDHRFHHYVRPTACPSLTSFCTHLTGIIQEMVDSQLDLPETLKVFDKWLKESELAAKKFAFVTCGDWDLQLMLPSEAQNKGIVLPEYFNSWINVKKSYGEHTGTFPKGMKDLLRLLQLKHTGRHHSGIDDVENICAITRELGMRGYHFRITGSHNPSNDIRKRLFNNKPV